MNADKIVTGVATVLCVGACVYLWATGGEPPAALLAITSALLGRYIPVPGALVKKEN